MLAVMKKELRSYFTSMIGWIVLFIFYAVSGAVFYLAVLTDIADLQVVLYIMMICGLVTAPLLTMRLMSDEKKQKTDQLLLTAPVKLSSIVLGKYFAALIVYSLCVVMALVYAFVIGLYADVAWVTILLTVLGLFLSGAALIAIGLFMSSVTESQIIALIGSFGIMILIFALSVINNSVSVGWLNAAITQISFFDRYTSFLDGILDISDILFFISVSAVFNFFTVRVLEKKRWS